MILEPKYTIFFYIFMTQKILFWLGVEFTHFCLSNILQKHLDADYYSVIDITSKPRNFFNYLEGSINMFGGN